MNVFDEVKQALNIRQVVEHYGVKVNMRGQFACPFHNDKHPSASIRNDYFNCFVCNTGGDLIKFTATMFGLSNYDACKKLIDDFRLNITLKSEEVTPRQIHKQAEQKSTSLLRAYKDTKKTIHKVSAVRIAEEQKKRDNAKALEELTAHTGVVLASYHCYLWQGKQLYPFEDKRHIRALQELTQAQYYIECYDNEPESYSVSARKQVEEIERRLHSWNNEG